MPRWLDRLTTRAASGETRALPGAGTGMGNTIATPTSAPGGVSAATQPVTYAGPGTPQMPTWDGRAAIDNGYYQSVWVQRTLGAIAETISALPFVAGMDPENPAVTNPNAPLARLLGPATPQAPGGPHNGTSSQAFLQWSIIQKLATGKMAWQYQFDPKAKGPTGQPAIVGLWPLVSFLLNPVPTSGGAQWFSEFRYDLPKGAMSLKANEVFYVWKKSQRDWRQPESYLQAAALPISISIAIERYSWALLQNGLVATHVITSAPLEEPDMRRAWEEQFISNFTGFDQAGKPIFAYADIENGKVTDAFNIQSIAQTSEQAQLLALAAWVKDEILVATGVPESLIGNASQRIYANADSEYRAFWTSRVLNLVAELQDDINTQLAPLLGPEVGWFDLSRVVALQPPTPFMQPQLTDLISAGIMSVAEAQQQLGVSDSGFIDTSDAPIGEESSSTGAGAPGKASAPMPETRGWSWEYRGMNLNTYRSGTWRRLVHQRERIVVRPTPSPVIDVASTPLDTRGYDKALEVLATVTSLREKRTPDTAAASTVHHKIGKTGQPLWKHKGQQLPAYIQNLAKHFVGSMGESAGIAQAVGIIRDWSEGHDGHGHKVHPDVQAAAARAIADFDADKHTRDDDAWADLDRLAKEHDLEPRAVAEFGPGGAGSTFTGVGNNPDASGAGLLLPIAEGLKPKPREAELAGPHRYTPNVRDAKHCAKCGKGPLAQVHKDYAAVKRFVGDVEVMPSSITVDMADPVRRTSTIVVEPTPQRSSVAAVEALLGRPVESRHRGPDHVHVPTGHANTPVRKRQAMKAAHKQALSGYEAAFTGSMRDLFAKQEKSALVRLTGRRGRQMVKRAQLDLEARATSQPGPVDPTTAPTSEPAPPQPASVDPAALFDSAFWTQKTIDTLIPSYDKVAEGSTAVVRAQLGPAVTDEVHSLGAAQIKAALRARAATVAAQVSSTTYQAIARQLGEGITQGESIPQLADRVKSVFADASDNRATLLARTETNSVVNSTALKYAQSLPQGIVAGKEWLCFAADTRVASAKPIQVMQRRRSQGFMTSLRTREGRLLSVTPNHPILTNRGWVAANSLNVGDYLVCYLGADTDRREPGGARLQRGLAPDEENVPPRIDEVFRTASLTAAGRRVMTTVPDLYSDPIDCEVEVVPVDSDLAAHVQAPLGEPRSKFILECSDVELEALVHGGSFFEERLGSLAGALRDPGSASLDATPMLSLGVLGSNQLPSSTPGSALDPSVLQVSLDDVIGDAEPQADLPCRLAVLVRLNDGCRIHNSTPGLYAEALSSKGLFSRRGVSVEPESGRLFARSNGPASSNESAFDGHDASADILSNISAGLASEIALDELIDVETSLMTTGHCVYDLGTEQGWLVANGIIAHNSVHDSRTRTDHRLADGQRQPLDVPFRVGGYAMQHPGDPTAPIGEVANCRCATLMIPQSQSHLLLQQPPKDFTFNPEPGTSAA